MINLQDNAFKTDLLHNRNSVSEEDSMIFCFRERSASGITKTVRKILQENVFSWVSSYNSNDIIFTFRSKLIIDLIHDSSLLYDWWNNVSKVNERIRSCNDSIFCEMKEFLFALKQRNHRSVWDIVNIDNSPYVTSDDRLCTAALWN